MQPSVLIDATVTKIRSRSLWGKWHKWVKLRKYYHHAKLTSVAFKELKTNKQTPILLRILTRRAGQKDGSTLIITQTHIFPWESIKLHMHGKTMPKDTHFLNFDSMSLCADFLRPKPEGPTPMVLRVKLRTWDKRERKYIMLENDIL